LQAKGRGYFSQAPSGRQDDHCPGARRSRLAPRDTVRPPRIAAALDARGIEPRDIYIENLDRQVFVTCSHRCPSKPERSSCLNRQVSRGPWRLPRRRRKCCEQDHAPFAHPRHHGVPSVGLVEPGFSGRDDGLHPPWPDRNALLHERVPSTLPGSLVFCASHASIRRNGAATYSVP
jgi:hypothetical protein